MLAPCTALHSIGPFLGRLSGALLSPGPDDEDVGCIEIWGVGCKICCWVGIAVICLTKNPHILFFNGKLIVLLFPPYGPLAQHPAGMQGAGGGLLGGCLKRDEAPVPV